MQILNLIETNQVKFRHTLRYKFQYDRTSITIDDQEDACKYPQSAFSFAKLKIPGTNIEKCHKAACKGPWAAYSFAKEIPGADIECCQEHACKTPYSAYLFARDVPGANMEYCRNACIHDEYWLNEFDKMIAKINANN